ncbi:hypothetical protein EpBp7_0063 [Escherichia phage Bp7]|uniref:Uncharacterized protein n=1 Tax=Escherichia phage Bp7 TaxID=1052121 RepID=G3MUU5_9CAUD|nr:hypothetical protein F392_gp176 [Escherichia phage Bp7]AEN93780.1 hypothetical protein EpBp7_0063 [Escherichia phage Bp7]
MGKTIRRKELSVKDFYYSGRRKAPDGVSQELVEENIFRSDKWKRMRGVDSEVKNEMNRQLRKEVRKLKKMFTTTMNLITILLIKLQT